eukprot:1154374-Pelagomonas_calceolata.AAC.2
MATSRQGGCTAGVPIGCACFNCFCSSVKGKPLLCLHSCLPPGLHTRGLLAPDACQGVPALLFATCLHVVCSLVVLAKEC